MSSMVMMNLAAGVITVIAMVFFMGRAKLKQSGKFEEHKAIKAHNKFLRYNNYFLTRNKFRRIVRQYSTLACYDTKEVEKQSVAVFEKALFSSLAMPVAGLILFRDVLLTLMVSLIAYVYYDITVDSAIDSMYEKIVGEVSMCIQSIRERYLETDNVAVAVANSDKGKYLQVPVMAIYDMLTSVNSEDKLDDFCRASPVRVLKTLAIVCYIVNERGDQKNDEGGSVFADEMTALRQETDSEIRRLMKTRMAFKSLPTLALVGLIITPLIDMFLTSQIPGTTTLIRGFYGLMEKTLIIAITLFAYYKISIYKRPTVVSMVDTTKWIKALSEEKKYQKFLHDIMPKNVDKRVKLTRLLSESISHKTPEYVYMSRVIYSVSAFVVTFIFLISFMLTYKHYMWNNYNSFSFVNQPKELKGKALERYYAADEYYMMTKPKMEDAELVEYLRVHVPELTSLEIENERERMSTKYDKYYAIGFKWYYCVIALLGGIAGWFAPEQLIKMRQSLVQFEDGEDIMQMQSMMIVLSQTSMGVYDVLYWLMRQSSLHKHQFSFAMQEYISDPELALDRLRNSSSIPDFKRLVSKLSASVYTLSLTESFSDVRLDKEQLLRVRELQQDEILDKKKTNARMLASAPITVALIGGFVGPIIILGFTEIIRMFAQLMG